MPLDIPTVFPSGTVVKNLPANARDTSDEGSIPGLGKPPGVGNGSGIFQARALDWGAIATDGLNSEGPSKPSELQQTPGSASRAFVTERKGPYL